MLIFGVKPIICALTQNNIKHKPAKFFENVTMYSKNKKMKEDTQPYKKLAVLIKINHTQNSNSEHARYWKVMKSKKPAVSDPIDGSNVS